MNQPQQQQATPHPSAKRHVWRRWLTGLLLVLVILWLFGVPAWLVNRNISRALVLRDYETAEIWVSRAEAWRCANAETAFWKARLSRKLLELKDFPNLLATAKSRGFDPDRIRTEAVLFQAQIGQMSEVVQHLNDLMVQPGDDGAEICEAYVNGALIAGSRDVARMIIPVWKQEFPQDPQPHYAHARLLEFEGQNVKAEQELRTAIQKHPDHAPSRYALGRMLFDQNKLDAARSHFLVAARMQHNAAPLLQVARCDRAAGHPEIALPVLLKLVELPDDSVARSFSQVGEPEFGLPIPLELGLVQSTLENSEQAVRWLDLVLNHDPQNLDARYARALALRDLGHHGEAEREFEQVQTSRTLLLEVDRLVDEINDTPGALHLEKRCRIGELFIKYENARRGEFWLRETLNLDPNYAPAHALLAEYYARLGKKDPAYRSLAERHRVAAELHKNSEDR